MHALLVGCVDSSRCCRESFPDSLILLLTVHNSRLSEWFTDVRVHYSNTSDRLMAKLGG